MTSVGGTDATGRPPSRKFEQLWYTWAETGISNSTGFQVRAASPGLRNVRWDRLPDLKSHKEYAKSPEVDWQDIEKDAYPLTLRFAGEPGNRTLLQNKYVGLDGHGRAGNHFLHAITGLPDDFSARHAISLWRSEFWKDVDDLDRGETSLPLVTGAELGKGLKPLDCRGLEEQLEFVILALLSLPPAKRLVIAAPPDDVARLVFGAAVAVPASAAAGLTFSTFESDFRNVPTRVVGTCWQTPGVGVAPPPRSDFPVDSFVRIGAALDCFRGECTDVRDDADMKEYAKISARLLSDGDVHGVEELHRAAERPVTVRGLQLAYRLREGRDLTTENFEEALVPARAANLLAHKRSRRALIETVLRDALWWERTGQALLRDLRASPEPGVSKALTELEDDAAGQAADLLLSHDDVGASVLVRGLASTPSACRTFFDRVAAVAAPSGLSTPEREVMLVAMGAFIADLHLAVRSKWLAVPFAELDHLLSLRIPAATKVEAAKLAIQSADESIEPWPVVLRHGAVFREAVASLLRAKAKGVVTAFLVRDPAGSSLTADQLLFALSCGTPAQSLFDDLVRNGVIYDEELRGVIEGTIAPSNAVSPQQRFRRAVELLGNPAYARLVDRYVNRLVPDDLRLPTTVAVLTALDTQTGLHKVNRRKVADWLTLSHWVVEAQRPQYPNPNPRDLTGALQRLLPGGVSTKFWHQILRPAIVHVASQGLLFADLVNGLAPLDGCSPQELYLQLYSERLRIGQPVGSTVEAPMAFMVHAAANPRSLDPPLANALVPLLDDYDNGVLGRIDLTLGRFASKYLSEREHTKKPRKPAKPFTGPDFRGP